MGAKGQWKAAEEAHWENPEDKDENFIATLRNTAVSSFQQIRKVPLIIKQQTMATQVTLCL